MSRDFLYSLPGSQSVHPNTTPTNTGNCGCWLCGEAGPGPPGLARCWCCCQATPSPKREPCTRLPAWPGADQGLPVVLAYARLTSPQGVWGLPRPDREPSFLGKAGARPPQEPRLGGRGPGALVQQGRSPPCARISVAGGAAGMSREGGSGTRSGPSGSGGTRAAGEGAAPS